ncbi:MAG TPA: glycosyltransferase [Acidimicrobiales bacterium]|nr:glycosyltransferase [Acidimicrobiales bacterium]
MIVRDESAVLGRCVASVRDLVDAYVIVDTGSTDRTCDVVRETLAGVPGELHERPWHDFGRNRSELMHLAQGCADYLLLLDADMTLRRHAPLPHLSADAYLIGYEGALAYAVPRLVRGDRRWRYVGATHEYLASDLPFETARLAELSVEHHGDGGSRADKFARDRALLEAQLRIQPEDPRTVFYLAQTYRDLGERERALALYDRRAHLGGWDEEVFYAALQRGILTAEDDFAAGVDLLLAAFELRPRRFEPLYEIAVRARQRGDFSLAEWVTQLATDPSLPPDLLFVHRFVYEWGLRLERSIALGHLGRIDEARALTEALLASPSLPTDVVAALTSNLAWLESRPSRDDLRRPPGDGRLSTLSALSGATIVNLPRVGPPGSAGETSPSIAGVAAAGEARQDRCSPVAFRGIVRSVNYELSDGRYTIHDPAGVVRTTNVLLDFDAELSITAALQLRDGELPERHQTYVEGFEDCRLFSWRERWWAVATNRELSADGLCRQVLLALGEPPTHGCREAPAPPSGASPPQRTAALELEAVLLGPEPGRHEKNWMPFVVGDALHFVYSCRPFTVLRFEPATAQLEAVVQLETDYRFAGLRGGSQGLPVDDGYLFVVHQVFDSGGRRSYAHRFLSVGPALLPTGISRAFCFVGAAVEFCTGIASHGGDVLLGFGIEDRSAALARLSLDAVIELIEPVGNCI